ncbi:histidine kinase N-terminal 7TM domain-containing protein [Leptospira fletcheri]|uniref:histidine kinase N-terminal 7TM domain-containing protein n=1 Tax=Leptospira fletcheri TaxID=2484981 RepID=UPI0014386302|nr:histidine kinase N-terminal 7TM domain-containing protein [Leptospira fletcheri]
MDANVQISVWFRWTPFAILPVFSFCLSTLTLLLSIRNRNNSGAKEFIALSLGMTLYNFGYFWEMVSVRDHDIIFWDNFQFLGPDIMVVSLPLLVMRILNLDKFVKPITLVLFALVPAAIEYSVWFGKPEWIRLSYFFDESAPWRALVYEYGPWMDVYVYNFLGIFSICLLGLLIGAVFQRGFSRIRSTIILIGLCIPFFTQIMTIGKFMPFVHSKLDIFPVAASLSCLIWLYGLFYFRILDLIPLARDRVFEWIEDVVFVLNRENSILDCNQAALDLLKAPRLYGDAKLSEFLPDLSEVLDQSSAEGKTKAVWRCAKSHCHFDVSIKPLGELNSSYRIVTLRDMTERVLAEQKISERRDILQSILDSTKILFLVLDGEGRLILLNKACLEITGYELSQLEGRSFWEQVLFPKDKERVMRVFRQRFGPKRFPHRTNIRLKRQDEKSRYTTWEHKEVRDEKGNLLYVISTGADVTGLEEAEGRIHTLQTANEEISSKSSIIEEQKKELEKTLQNLRQTQAKLIQTSKLADLGQLAAGIAHEINNPIGAIQAAGHNILSYLGRIREGIRSHLEGLCTLSPPEWDLFEKFIHLGIESREMTIGLERRRLLVQLKEEMIESKVLLPEETAELFVDHGIVSRWKEFLPLLTLPKTRELLPFFLDLLGPEQSVGTIRTAVERSSKIVYALRSFAHFESSHRKRPFTLKDNVDTVLTLYQNLFKHGVEVSTDLTEVPSLLGFPDDLMHLWTNLIMNSVQAMNYKGKLAIRGRLSSDREVLVSVEDNGPGILSDVKGKVFDAFFTTKAPGEGSGLGLDIAKRIVEKHEGRIWFESEPGKTVFYVALPYQPA